MGWFTRRDREVRRLTEAQVRMVRNAYRMGHSQADIADAYDLPPSTVNDIVLHRTWKDV